MTPAFDTQRAPAPVNQNSPASTTGITSSRTDSGANGVLPGSSCNEVADRSQQVACDLPDSGLESGKPREDQSSSKFHSTSTSAEDCEQRRPPTADEPIPDHAPSSCLPALQHSPPHPPTPPAPPSNITGASHQAPSTEEGDASGEATQEGTRKEASTKGEGSSVRGTRAPGEGHRPRRSSVLSGENTEISSKRCPTAPSSTESAKVLSRKSTDISSKRCASAPGSTDPAKVLSRVKIEILSKRCSTDPMPSLDSKENDAASKKRRMLSSSAISSTTVAHSRHQRGTRGGSASAARADVACLSRHNVRIVGSGKTILFLAHGFGTNQTVWDGVTKHLDLETEFRVVLWDLVGAFSTSPETYDARRYSSLHAHADDLLEVLEELDMEGVTYVGHSMSGMVGLLASIECPRRFSRLILLGTSCRYLNDPATGYSGGFDVADLDQLFSALQSNYTTWVSGFSSAMVGGSIDSPSVRELSRTLFLLRPDIAFMTLKMVFQSDFRHVLPKVHTSVQFIQTERDEAVPQEVTAYMVKNLPKAQMEVLPLAGHLPHLTHPSLVARAITKHARQESMNGVNECNLAALDAA